MTEKILLYEELSLNALPALQTQFYDGWVLRYTSGYGYTSRANSVNILYPSKIDISAKVVECEKRYFGQGLPMIFKITDGTDSEFDQFLDKQGYMVANPTYMMVADIAANYNEFNECILKDCIDEEWMHDYFALSKYVEPQKISIAKQVFANIKVAVFCCRIIKAGSTVACGLCVVERGYAGLFNIVVDEAHRGNGYGQKVCEALISAAKTNGAQTSYLQVVQDNFVAVNLYKKLGFNTLYSYWYRVKKGNDQK